LIPIYIKLTYQTIIKAAIGFINAGFGASSLLACLKHLSSVATDFNKSICW
jgi:hypothetical protein